MIEVIVQDAPTGGPGDAPEMATSSQADVTSAEKGQQQPTGSGAGKKKKKGKK